MDLKLQRFRAQERFYKVFYTVTLGSRPWEKDKSHKGAGEAKR
jgi:hypothetical protein